MFAQLLTGSALFQGRTELDQMDQIFRLLGTPSEEIWQGYSTLPAVQYVRFAEQPFNMLRRALPNVIPSAVDLVKRFLTYDPNQRITAAQALQHPFFSEEPAPARIDTQILKRAQTHAATCSSTPEDWL